MNETQRERRGHAFLPDVATLAQIPALYETDGVPLPDKTVWAVWFCGTAHWMLMELDTESLIGFGWADLGDPQNAELGYFDLHELETLSVPTPTGVTLIVERDLHWMPTRYCEI